jgi:magnesium-transporting ATPase (P-type)
MTRTSFHGLTSEEAAERLRRYGPNALPRDEGPSVFDIIVRTLREPMFLLLAAAAILYLVIGDLGEGLFMVFGAGAAISSPQWRSRSSAAAGMEFGDGSSTCESLATSPRPLSPATH